ncbi:MAG: oligosaccharide flippase family protein [Candidatus Babeliaceae bacterium]
MASYIGAVFLCKGLMFSITLYALHSISPRDIGLIALLNNFFSLFTIVIGGSLRQIIALEFYHQSNDANAALINDIIIIYSTILLIFFAIILTISPYINALFFAHQATKKLIIISFLYNFLLFFMELFVQLLLYNAQITYAIYTQVLAVIVTTLCSYGALHIYGTPESLLLASTSGTILVCSMAFYVYVSNNFFATYNIMRSLKKTLNYIVIGLPLMPPLVMGGIIGWLNRTLLTHTCGLQEVGLYALVDMANSCFNAVVLHPVQSTYAPYMLKKFSQQQHAAHMYQEDIYNKYMMLMSMTALILCVPIGFFILRSYGTYVLPAYYCTIMPALAITIIAHIFLMGTYFLSLILQFHKQIWFLNTGVIATSMIAFFAGYLLIPHYKITGAVAAILCAYVSYFFIIMILNNVLHKKIRA